MPDTVDDLHAAEDEVSRLKEALRSIVHAQETEAVGVAARRTYDIAVAAVGSVSCRPTCGWMDSDVGSVRDVAHGHPSQPECQSGGPPECGCPCGHPDPAPGGP